MTTKVLLIIITKKNWSKHLSTITLVKPVVILLFIVKDSTEKKQLNNCMNKWLCLRISRGLKLKNIAKDCKQYMA